MDTYTDIYNKSIVNSLMLYENERRTLDDNVVTYLLELEFNEERAIKIELHLNKNDVIDLSHVFYMIVCDARDVYHNTNNKEIQDYIECQLAAKRLCFLVGEYIFNKLMKCNMNCRV